MLIQASVGAWLSATIMDLTDGHEEALAALAAAALAAAAVAVTGFLGLFGYVAVAESCGRCSYWRTCPAGICRGGWRSG
jgi:hypothetical protein